MTSDEVGNFLEHDKALCAKALDYGRDVVLRAAEMIGKAEQAAQERTTTTDVDPT